MKKASANEDSHVQVSHKKMAKLFKWHKSQHKKVYHTPTQYLPNNRVGPEKLIVKSTFLQVFYLLVMYWLIIVYVDIFRKNNKICCTFIRQVRVLTSSTYLPTYIFFDGLTNKKCTYEWSYIWRREVSATYFNVNRLFNLLCMRTIRVLLRGLFLTYIFA